MQTTTLACSPELWITDLQTGDVFEKYRGIYLVTFFFIGDCLSVIPQVVLLCHHVDINVNW